MHGVLVRLVRPLGGAPSPAQSGTGRAGDSVSRGYRCKCEHLYVPRRHELQFWAGANYGRKYQPTVTSYDDAALLNEYGDYTPAYHRVRKILRTAQGLPMDEALPPRPKLQHIGAVELMESAPLWETCYRIGQRHISAHLESMEHFGQNFGYILYRKVLKGNYSAQPLCVEGVHDIAYLRINGKWYTSMTARRTAV